MVFFSAFHWRCDFDEGSENVSAAGSHPAARESNSEEKERVMNFME
jgi:hypothetical protein